MKPNNPFLISGYYSPEYFCNRERETQTITDALYNGRNLTLIAPRRMGEDGAYQTCFPSAQGAAGRYRHALHGHLLDAEPRRFRTARQYCTGTVGFCAAEGIEPSVAVHQSCRPVFTFDELTGVPKVIIEIAPAAEETTLKEIFDYLKSSDKRCYIAIDEFQQIADYPEKGVEALLRSYIQFIPNVNFIFAGSKQHVMQEMFLSAKRPFTKVRRRSQSTG